MFVCAWLRVSISQKLKESFNCSLLGLVYSYIYIQTKYDLTFYTFAASETSVRWMVRFSAFFASVANILRGFDN